MTGMTAGVFGENYEQDVSGRNVKLTQTLGGNSYTKRYGYYKQGDHATNRVNTIYYGKNGVTDGKATYTYDGMGNIISVNENGKQRYKYTYDKLNRIISEKDLYKNKEVCYTYDNNGNILTKSIDGEITEYRYKEGSDRLVQYGTETISYDGMGNPTTYKGLTCTWEKGRQLKSVTDGANTATYSYDVFGLRSGKTIGNETTSYIYENGKLLRQVTGGEVIDFYYGSEGVIGFKLSGCTEVTNGNYLYRKNLFGDITGIINESGALVYEYSYSAFGKSDKEEETGIGAKNPFRYRGYYYDEETGLYYLKSRYYDPETGRFITIDDISYIDPETINGLNLYAYCGNNPVMRIDENGNAWWHWLLGALAVVLVSVITAGAAAAFAGLALGITGTTLTSIGVHALVGGLVVGGINLASQAYSVGIENINYGTLVVSTIGGALSGAIGGSTAGLGMQLAANALIGMAQYTFTTTIEKEPFSIRMMFAMGVFSIIGITLGGAMTPGSSLATAAFWKEFIKGSKFFAKEFYKALGKQSLLSSISGSFWGWLGDWFQNIVGA